MARPFYQDDGGLELESTAATTRSSASTGLKKVTEAGDREWSYPVKGSKGKNREAMGVDCSVCAMPHHALSRQRLRKGLWAQEATKKLGGRLRNQYKSLCRSCGKEPKSSDHTRCRSLAGSGSWERSAHVKLLPASTTPSSLHRCLNVAGTRGFAVSSRSIDRRPR